MKSKGQERKYQNARHAANADTWLAEKEGGLHPCSHLFSQSLNLEYSLSRCHIIAIFIIASSSYHICLWWLYYQDSLMKTSDLLSSLADCLGGWPRIYCRLGRGNIKTNCTAAISTQFPLMYTAFEPLIFTGSHTSQSYAADIVLSLTTLYVPLRYIWEWALTMMPPLRGSSMISRRG